MLKIFIFGNIWECCFLLMRKGEIILGEGYSKYWSFRIFIRLGGLWNRKYLYKI